MSSKGPPTISDLIKRFKVTQEQLQDECSDEHLEKFGQCKAFCKGWKHWLEQLGLPEKIKCIDGMRLDDVGKAQKALSEWHTLIGFMATYEKLVETFLEGGNALLAGEVCKLLKTKSDKKECDQCTPLQTSFLNDLKKQLEVFKSLSSEAGESLIEDAVRKFVEKFNLAGSASGVVHLHEHLQLLHQRDFLINNPKVLEMAKRMTDGMRRPRSNSISSADSGTCTARSSTLQRTKPTFSKSVVYNASVCCQAVHKCVHENCSEFFTDVIDGHSFKEVSISQSKGDRYLIAVQKSIIYVAFQAESDIGEWPVMYQSFSEGISSRCKHFPISFIFDLLRNEKNHVVLTGFSLGGLLACSVYAHIMSYPNITSHFKGSLMCITFAQPHIPVPWLDRVPEDSLGLIHSIQFEKDCVPRILGLIHHHSKSFDDLIQKFESLIRKDGSPTSLTDALVQELGQLSSNTSLAEAIPDIQQPLTYHLLFSGPDSEDFEFKKMTSEEISTHVSYYLDKIPADVENFQACLENHSIEVYHKTIDIGFLKKPPEFTIPPKQSTPPQPVQSLIPHVASVDLINHGSELDLVVEGKNLWFYSKLSLNDCPIEPTPRIEQNIGTCLHVKISGECSSHLLSLKDGQKVTIGFHTHFSYQKVMNVQCHTKAYVMNRRQEQLAKLTPSQVIELSYLNALLEYHPQDSSQPLSQRMLAIRKFLEEVVKVVPLESIGYSVAYGDEHTQQQCAKALDTLCDLNPSKMMIDALTKAKQNCDVCSSVIEEGKDPETGLTQEKDEPNPTGNCLCSLITRLLNKMGKVEESTSVISGLDVKALYPITRTIQGLKSPIDTLQYGRSRLHSLSLRRGNNNDMLKVMNLVRQQDLAVCISLLGAFMDQQEINIPLSKCDVSQFNVAAKATVGVWALANLDLEYVKTLVAESPGKELVVKVEDYMRNVIEHDDDRRRVSKDGQYAAKLQFIVQGLQKTVTCNTECISYSLERQLAELCKDKPAIHPDRLEELVRNWDSIFDKSILSLVAITHRPMIARWLNWSLMVHKLREELAKYTTVGVVGPVNSGKSTIAKSLFKLDMIYSGTTDEKRTTVPFIYNLKRRIGGPGEGLDVDIVDFPGVDDRDESVSDLTPLLLHLVQIVIFVVNYKVAHTGSCKRWLETLQELNAPLLVCLTHSDKLYAEVRRDLGIDPTEKQMKEKFKTLSTNLELPDHQTIMFCSFDQDADSVLNNDVGRKKMAEVGIHMPEDVGEWIVETFKKTFKQSDVAAMLGSFMSSK